MVYSPPMTAPSGPNPNPTGLEIVSQGVHSGEVEDNLRAAAYDKVFAELLVDAGLIPTELRAAKILPAVTYGIKSPRSKVGAVEVVPGTSSLMTETLGSDYFNPHLSLRTRAHNLLEVLQG